MDLKTVEKRTVFLSVVGSRAYGTHHDGSDYDKAGVMIPPSKYFFGLDKFEQFRDFPGEDKVIYDFKKALSLISDNNPNMLDLLFTPERCILKIERPWEIMIDNRDLFISKKCRHTYSGYAFAQLRRIETHRKFLLNPPKVKPERVDFGLPEVSIFPTAQLKAVVYAAMGDFLIEEEKDNFLDELDDVYSNYVMPIFNRYIKPDFRALALEYLQVGIKSQSNTLRALGPSYIREEYLEMATRELQFYSADVEWRQFQAWLKGRNKARADLEIKFGYDCYADDTEFLTNEGWKFYDEIDSSMQLGTIKNDDLGYKLCTKSLIGESYRSDYYADKFCIEYQPFIDRFEGLYSGDMYNFIGNHMDILVTPNHRMLFRPIEKNTGKIGEFVLEEASILPTSFEFLRTVTPWKRIYKNPLELSGLPINITQYLSLMGWYLSEGCLNFNGKSIKNIRISQKKGGRLSRYLTQFYNRMKTEISCNLYCYKRKPNSFNPNEIEEEEVLVIYNKTLKEKIYNDCSSRKEKRIPRWAFKLSKRLKDVLLNALCMGDGTVKDTALKSWVYYSTLKNLADDVQELALTCGYETSLYGPYEEKVGGDVISMYQVHINKNISQFDRLERSKNMRRISVNNKRIVCFTVLNRTLITRRNGHVAFQGNSKHAAHLVRLIRMCKEILETGKVNVDRTGIDAEELKDIRHNGIWSFEQLESYAKEMDSKAETLYKAVNLKRSPDMDKIKALCESICEDYILKNR